MDLYWFSDPPPETPVASGRVPVELELLVAEGLETTRAHLGEGYRCGDGLRMLCRGVAIAGTREVAEPAAELVRAYDEHHGRIVLRRAG